jgi:L-lactate dehydrogenase complex protein LldE
MNAPPRTVGLFVTCLVDLFRPSVGAAAVKLLEDAGFQVRVPLQSCCGQANFNGGDRAGAAQLALNVIKAFKDCEFVVVPSGSCAAMIREYPALFAEGSAGRADALALTQKTFELTAFMRDVARIGCGVESPTPMLPVRWPATVAYHDSCSSLRQLGVREQPRALLGQVDGLKLAELRAPEECCGFGGTFCVKYPELSAHIADRKIDEIVATGATHLVGADLGCLLHLEGRMQKRGIAVRAVHVAEALADMVPRGDDGYD